jgi:hypothetical protein
MEPKALAQNITVSLALLELPAKCGICVGYDALDGLMTFPALLPKLNPDSSAFQMRSGEFSRFFSTKKLVYELYHSSSDAFVNLG